MGSWCLFISDIYCFQSCETSWMSAWPLVAVQRHQCNVVTFSHGFSSEGPHLRFACKQSYRDNGHWALSAVELWGLSLFLHLGGKNTKETCFEYCWHGFASRWSISAPNMESMALPVCRRPENDVARQPLRKVPDTVQASGFLLILDSQNWDPKMCKFQMCFFWCVIYGLCCYVSNSQRQWFHRWARS